MPIVGDCTGGSSNGGATHDSAVMLARYQLSAAVSDVPPSNWAITPSASGWWDQARKFAQSSSVSQRSATSWNWNSSMYQDFMPCSRVVNVNAAG